jgi:hypothetical protein
MLFHAKHTAVLILGLVLVAVMACGGPSEAEIEAIVEARVQEQRDLDVAITTIGPTPTPTPTLAPVAPASPTADISIFTDSGQSIGDTPTRTVLLVDVDSDGDLDAFVMTALEPSEFGGFDHKIWINDGFGTFVDGGEALGFAMNAPNFGGFAMNAPNFGDLDNDGDVDVVAQDWQALSTITSSNNGYIKIWLNDGSGIFTDSGRYIGDMMNDQSSLGDLDGDGDLDVLIFNYEGPAKIWLNDGSGIFTDSGKSFGNEGTAETILADFDNDGDLDAFFSKGGSFVSVANKIWLNDGYGNFTDSGQQLGDRSTGRIIAGDLDNDGDLDVIGHAYMTWEGKVSHYIWLNDGSGTFTDNGGSFIEQGDGVGGNFFGDLDSDGDLDVLLGNDIWLNDGNGIFTYSGALYTPVPSHASLGDLDGDGDLDVFLGMGYTSDGFVDSPDKVLFNNSSP